MEDVFIIDNAYLNVKRNEIKRDVSYARYKVGNTWYRTAIVSADVLPSGVVEVTFVIDHTVRGNITVTGVELYGRSGARIGSRAVSITRADVVEGVLYVCRFSLFQVVDSADNTGAYEAMQ